jgi:hypothetical protein
VTDEIPTGENAVGGTFGAGAAAGNDGTAQPSGGISGSLDSGTGGYGYGDGHGAAEQGARTGSSGTAADAADPGETAPWDISGADGGESAGAGGNGGNASGDSPMAGAARVFDVATTRRRPVIFEEDDDLDVPDFLK